jgi:hypothetical protein
MRNLVLVNSAPNGFDAFGELGEFGSRELPLLPRLALRERYRF